MVTATMVLTMTMSAKAMAATTTMMHMTPRTEIGTMQTLAITMVTATTYGQGNGLQYVSLFPTGATPASRAAQLAP